MIKEKMKKTGALVITLAMLMSVLILPQVGAAVGVENDRTDCAVEINVKGIGLKTAQRIIVDLKDKIGTTGIEAPSGYTLQQTSHSEVHEEAVAALTMLGFPQAPSQKVVISILKEEPELTVEKVIKLALKRL